MIRRLVIIALGVILAVTVPAAAAPRKVIVLPLDGTADAQTRAKVTASIQRMARILDGAAVTPGDATFSETAAAVGCNPAAPTCLSEVRAMLGVDEIVYGTAEAQGGQVNVVVKRASKTLPPRELAVVVSVQDSPAKLDTAILPVFSADDTTTLVDPQRQPHREGAPQPPPPPPVVDPEAQRARNIGIVCVVGGGTMLLIGLAMWSSASGVQDDIDAAPITTRSDFDRLVELEDKAAARAWGGNVLVLAGLALGGYAGYRLYQYRKNKRVLVTPTPIEGGAALTVTVLGGL